MSTQLLVTVVISTAVLASADNKGASIANILPSLGSKPCPAIPLPENGRLELSHGEYSHTDASETYPSGTIAAFRCDDGFRLSPDGWDGERICTDGVWKGGSDSNNVCVALGCPQPAQVLNGFYLAKSSVPCLGRAGEDPACSVGHVGTILRYGCDMGYVLHGPNVVECAADQRWTPHDPPLCEPTQEEDETTSTSPSSSCPPPPSADNIEWRPLRGWFANGGRAKIGTILQYACSNVANAAAESGCQRYESRRGATSMKCVVGGRWRGEVPTCDDSVSHKEQLCDLPPAVAHGWFYQDNDEDIESGDPLTYRINDIIHLACRTNYHPSPGSSIRCHSDLCWHPVDNKPGQKPHCIADEAGWWSLGGGTSWGSPTSSFMGSGGIAPLLVALGTGVGVLLVLLTACAALTWRRKALQQLVRQSNGNNSISSGINDSSEDSAQSGGVGCGVRTDVAAILDPDRLALIAYADGVMGEQPVLPSYEEAVRESLRNAAPLLHGSSTVGQTRSSLHFHSALTAPVSGRHYARNRIRNEQGLGLVVGGSGSTETVSTTGSTLETLSCTSSSQHTNGSSGASCRAMAGSLVSLTNNSEDVPLLEMEEEEAAEGCSVTSTRTADAGSLASSNKS